MSVPSDKKMLIETADPEQDAKSALRRSLLVMRCALDDAARGPQDRKICEHIARYLLARPPTTLGVYLSARNEPDLMELYTALSQKGVTLSLPVVTGKASPLQFAKWKPGDPLVRDRFGIDTPEIREFIPLPRMLLVPCLGFTPERFRLGYGGGYYDRTLEKEPRPHTIGVAYSCLEVRFPIQAYDVPMDCIMTETGVI